MMSIGQIILIIALQIQVLLATAIEQQPFNFTDFNPNVQLDDFGNQMMINYKTKLYDIVISLNEAQQARQFLKELITQYSLKPINSNLLGNSDLLSQVSFQEDPNSKKCQSCNKQFNTNPSIHYHIVRDHIQYYTFQIIDEGNSDSYYFIDRLCKFIDCSREKDQATSQSAFKQQKRVSHCLKFMFENFIQQENESEDIFKRKIFLLCKEIGSKDPSEIIGKTQSTFISVVWTIFFWIGVLMSISYYSVLLLTEEGRRAWLTKIEESN